MNNLETLAKEIKECQKCELRFECTQPVPGLGEVGAKYFIIGEAPGREEDRDGMPFVGMAGKRLNKLIGLGGISLNECYLTNVVKCRPPKNRQPKRAEVRSCLPWLRLELELIKPEYVITLGATPLKLFTDDGIRQLHGTMLTDVEIRE